MDLLHHKVIHHPKSKEWVVFVHGIGGSSSIWFKQLRDFKKHFNLLLIDLPGHGGNQKGLKDEFTTYNFKKIARRLLDVLDKHSIQHAHFIGISLGTIIIQAIEEHAPERIKSMVLGGAVEKVYTPFEILARMIEWVKHFVPYMWLYKIVAWILMPRKHHTESRKLFVREALKLGQKEFFCWYKIVFREINWFFHSKKRKRIIPTTYIMGSEDYMFLPSVKENCEKEQHSTLHILAETGHICNVEKEKEFNQLAIDFIESISNSKAS